MLKSPLTHRCSLAGVCFALIQYSPSSSRSWVSAGEDLLLEWVRGEYGWLPICWCGIFFCQTPWMSYAIQPISLTSLNSLLPSLSSPFWFLLVVFLHRCLVLPYWLKDQSKFPQINFTKTVWRKWNPSFMKANIPTNAAIRALDGGDYGSTEILHFVASPLMRQSRRPSQFLFFPDF